MLSVFPREMNGRNGGTNRVINMPFWPQSYHQKGSKVLQTRIAQGSFWSSCHDNSALWKVHFFFLHWFLGPKHEFQCQFVALTMHQNGDILQLLSYFRQVYAMHKSNECIPRKLGFCSSAKIKVCIFSPNWWILVFE